MTIFFTVAGPLDIPYYQGKSGRTITDENVEAFWKQHEAHALKRGCYVFGIRAGKGYTPAYVGQATNTFKQEVFSSHKLTRYQQVLADYGKGTPVLFFLVAPVKRGKPNKALIGDLEDYLIQTAVSANPDLMNIRGTKAEEWGISGVLRGGKGKASSAAKAFRKIMKI